MKESLMKIPCKNNHYFQNWSQTYSCKPELYFEPRCTDDLRVILLEAKQLKKKVKVVGGGLSPSDIACTNHFMISMKLFNKILEIDKTNCVITVESGVTIYQLNNHVLPSNGLALSNMGSVSGQCVGGIIGTGTHGTGGNFGSFASCVLEVTFMISDGSIIKCSKEKNGELFQAVCCHLGLLGIILVVKIQCEPAFKLHLKQASGLLEDNLVDLKSLISQSQHFRFFWFPHTDYVVNFMADRTKRPLKEGGSWFWSQLVGHYVLEFFLWVSTFFPCLVPFINRLFFKMCYSGSSESVRRSDRVFTFDCLFKQYVTEWAIPQQNTVTVLRKMREWIIANSHVKVHFPVEVRFVKQDGIMLAPSGDEDVTYIGIISFRPYGKIVPHDEWWNFFENLATEYGGKPHWAKAHKVKADDFRRMYPKFDRFMEIRRQLDPTCMFWNDYWRRVMGKDGFHMVAPEKQRL
uniref:L-gulonolactone oxidase n=1 Tax=Phallusia mammillata TaxID=59560 RepID=A0A6F9DF31_9ASCI|nr:L-gulonolactone oxidase-like [Phallusia mammillata]